MAKSADYDDIGKQGGPEATRAAFEADPIIDPPPQANGHDPQAPPAPEVLHKPEFTAHLARPEYLIDGILQRRFIYAMTGQTGHAKTAIALRLCKLVSQTKPGMLAGHAVDHGRVLYLVGENPDDVRMRVVGEDAANPEDAAKDDAWFVPGIFNIDLMFAHLESRVGDIGGVALVIVDTSAAYFPGNEELSNTQMGDYARKLRRLTTLPGGPCVVVLCHPIKHVTEPAQLLPRGGGAFLNEMDGNLTVWMKNETIELSHNKMRGPGFDPIGFRLEKVTSDRLTDSKGRHIPTVRAVPITTAEEERREQQTEDEENTLLIARLDAPNASAADLARVCGWNMADGRPYKVKVYRLCAKLAQDKLMRKYRNTYTLTEAGKKAALQAKETRAQQQTTRDMFG